MKKTLAVASAVAAVALPIASTTTSTAVAAPAAPTSQSGPSVNPPCGVNWSTYGVWYNHCGSNNVEIHITFRDGTGVGRCVGPGNTYLGVIHVVTWAQYVYPNCTMD